MLSDEERELYAYMEAAEQAQHTERKHLSHASKNEKCTKSSQELESAYTLAMNDDAFLEQLERLEQTHGTVSSSFSLSLYNHSFVC